MSRLVMSAGALVVLLVASASAFAQQPTSKSASLATELAKMMDQMKLEAVAANRGPADEYVGALYFPGSQLLVVSAKSSVPDRMKYLLIQKSYKDLYVELNGAVDQSSKMFISDLGANGLQFKREKNQPFDTVDATGKTMAYDGEWKKAKMSEADYTKTYQQQDEAYSQMLQSLLQTLKK